jgi:YHS domain-containing protein
MKGGKTMAKDPVCEMEVNEKEAAVTYEYKGKTYYFCAVECKEKFEKNPEKFLKKTEV